MCALMATGDHLSAEARERPRMAIAAGAAAVLTLAAAIIGIAGFPHPPKNLPASLLYRKQHEAAIAISTACSVLGLVAIAFVLDFLARATRARNEQAPPLLRPLPYVGAIGLAAVTVAIQVVLAVRLAHFATHGSQTYDEARKAESAGALLYLGLLMQLVFAAAVAMVSINAMRVGLLTRFLGYLGVFSALLFVIPFVPIPIVQVYWLGALAVLFLGRSPSGVPAAWERGEAVPWPSAQEQRERRVREAEARRDGEQAAVEPAVEGAAAPAPSADAARRKRKKRR
jgi:hypothetical protein